MRHPESVIGNWGLGNGGHMTPGEVRGALLILAVMVFAMLMGVWLGLSVPMAAPASQSLAAQPAPSATQQLNSFRVTHARYAVLPRCCRY